MILEHTLVRRVEFINENVGKENLNLGMSLDWDFYYNEESQKGFLEFTFEAIDKDEVDESQQFKISIKMHGLFSLNDENNVSGRIEEIRDTAADITYPYLVAYVAAFMPLAGLPALFLPTTLTVFDDEKKPN